MRPIYRAETSAINYHCLRCNNPEEHSSHLFHSGNLKFCTIQHVCHVLQLYCNSNSLWSVFYRILLRFLFVVPSGHAVAQWLRHCATNQKVAGSIPDGVIGIIHWHNPSGRIMTLGSTQPLTEMSTRNISGGKGGRCVGLTTLPPMSH
jgi:hypothetical protein